MASGVLLLRLVLGATMAGHGAQKLFGVFGGPGPQGAAGFFGALRFRSPFMLAIVASATELGCGILLALGLVTPLAALGIATVMVTAVGSVHLSKGFWNGNGGYEFNLLIWTVAVAIAAIGPLRFSVDHAIGWDGNISGFWWGVGVGVGSLVIGGLNLASRREEEEELVIEEVPDRESRAAAREREEVER
ncbi:MAG: putative oxidoreductase [Gaiellaceae bacterium]|nr:putative oxidoreductase [Gaiellaceae bacterium]